MNENPQENCEPAVSRHRAPRNPIAAPASLLPDLFFPVQLLWLGVALAEYKKRCKAGLTLQSFATYSTVRRRP